MGDASIMRAIQDYGRLLCSRTSGGVRSPQSWPSLAAGGASKGAKSRFGAPGAAYGSINGPSALGDAIGPRVAHKDQRRCSNLQAAAAMPCCMAVGEACAAADLGCEVYMCWRAVSSQGFVSAVRV